VQSCLRRHERDIFIDGLRVLAVLIVVVGHWATTTVIWVEGRISVENALSVIPEVHVATWLLQVMPLLFFVGGFANARSLARHDGEYMAYLRTRLARLLTPVLAFIAIWLSVGVAAEVLPLPESIGVERAADLAALPFWFLGMYVVVVALAPLLWRLHRRFGWWVPALLIVGVATVDLLVHGIGYAAVGVANYAFVWLLAHQLGFFYADGRLDRVSGASAGALSVAGLMGLVAAVTVGGYPMSMVGVPGEDRWNTEPPSLALVALTIWLLGLVLLARPLIQSWAGRRRRLVDRLNGSVLTIYLWHVSALALGAAAVHLLDVPRPDTGSALWWATRPLWLVVMVPFLALFVYGFRRFEVHPAPRPVAPRSCRRVRLVAVSIAVVSLALGIFGFGVSGFDRVVTEHGETILVFSVNPLQNLLHVAVGFGLLWVAYRSAWVLPGAAGGSLLYLVLGTVGRSTSIGLLAMNPATARLHVVMGLLGLSLLVLAVASDRRHAESGSPKGPATS
jgi:surface polysaccharide O-acyltransferase-like enzyme